MKHIKIMSAAAFVVLATGAMPPSQSEAAGNTICKSMTWGYGKHKVRAIARVNAFSKWKSNAGPTWNNWLLAKSRSKYCLKEGTKWNCGRKAIPCKKLGVSG